MDCQDVPPAVVEPSDQSLRPQKFDEVLKRGSEASPPDRDVNLVQTPNGRLAVQTLDVRQFLRGAVNLDVGSAATMLSRPLIGLVAAISVVLDPYHGPSGVLVDHQREARLVDREMIAR